MDYLPLFFNLKNRQCLVIGGGNVAQRKASLLLDAGAILRIVAPAIKDELAALNTKHGGSNLQQPFTHQHLDDVELVVAATDDTELNKRVSSQAQQRNIPVNVVDAPALSTIIFPAIIDRSPIVVAVSSGGASPVLARLLRTKIESLVPSAYGDLAHLVGGFREQVKKRFSSINIRRRFWEQVIEGPIADLVFSGQLEKAKTKLKSLLASDSPTSSGEVFLVGAGPGDPDLLTFKALRLMQKADVVLYDRLVSDAIVNLCRRDADRIYVGKRMADHSVPQDQINKKLVELAKAGKRVLRLKGGDPFIFGRGGEEIDELAANDIAFQVVPGITAASGCASYAGIPLTHRDYSQSVKFVTGHLKDGSLNLKWSELVHKNETVVFYMGLQGLAYICEHLIKAGRDKNTPVALIQKGTLPEQKVLLGTLETLPSIVAAAGAKAPTLIIVGEVVKLRDRLAWFDEV